MNKGWKPMPRYIVAFLCWLLCAGLQFSSRPEPDEHGIAQVLIEIAQRAGAMDAGSPPEAQVHEMIGVLRRAASWKSWPESWTGGVLDYYLDSYAAGSTRLASFREYVAERLLGVRSGKMLPEEASRQLADEALRVERLIASADKTVIAGEDKEHRASRADLNAFALLARYHSRKILAGAGLALFYATGDEAALRSAEAHIAACLEIWGRLVLIGDELRNVTSVFGPADAGRWRDGLVFVRYDIARLREVRAILERYELFDLGLEFGPSASVRTGASLPAYESSYSMERRFRPLDPGMIYTDQRGYGWLKDTDVRSSEPIQIARATLRGENLRDPLLPSRVLYRNYLRSSQKATLLVTLPDGEYVITAIVGNMPDLAGGSFRIRAGNSAVSYRAGESGDKSMSVRVTGGKLAMDFIPESGEDWLVSGLVITLRAPHIAHIPFAAAVSGSRSNAEATITAPDGMRSASIEETIPSRAEPVAIDLIRDGRQFSTVLDWRSSWAGEDLRYHIVAADSLGHASRLPARGEFVVRIQR